MSSEDKEITPQELMQHPDPPQPPLVAGALEPRFYEGCATRVGKASAQGLGLGILLGVMRMGWYPDPYRFGHKQTTLPYALNLPYYVRGLRIPATMATVICAVFTGTECVMESLRDERHDQTYVNTAIAGAAAGMVMGSLSKRIDLMATSALGMGMLMGMVEYNAHTRLKDLMVGSAAPLGVGVKWNEKMDVKESHESSTVQELKEKYPEYKHL